MPLKNIRNSPVYFPDGEGLYQELTLFLDIEDSNKQMIDVNFSDILQSYEIKFDIKHSNSLTSEELWLILSGVCTEVQILQNNWRRLHGLPMKRRMRCKKK